MQHARDQRRPRAEAHDQFFREAERERPHHDRRRQEGEADLERVVAEDPLQVEGAEEEHPEHPGDQQRLHRVGAGDVARAEEAQRHQRVGDPRLAGDEGAPAGRPRRRSGPASGSSPSRAR